MKNKHKKKNKNNILFIGGILLTILIIVVGIILGLPKNDNSTQVEYEEPILYIEYNAKLDINTDLKVLNHNYNNTLEQFGLESDDIRNFVIDDYTQTSELYKASFITKYGDKYEVNFNLKTNVVSLKRLNNQN